MSLPYQVFIGFRYLRAKRRNRSISVNTAISIAGVALGVMALVTVLAVMTGAQEDLRKKILGVSAHVIVMEYSGSIKDYARVAKAVDGEPHVIAYSPFILGQVMLGSGDRVHGVALRGIDPELEVRTSDLLENLVKGSLNFSVGAGPDSGDLNGKSLPESGDKKLPGIVIGTELSRILGVHLGDRVNMISPLGAMGPIGMIPRVKGFRVTGLFEVGMFEYNAGLAYIDIKSAQDFLNMKDSVTGVQLKLDDIYKAKEVSERIQEKLGFPYYSRDWIQMNRNLFAALKLEKIVMFLILVLIVLVAAFNIVSSLVMIVIEKSRDIAILKTMGATKTGIMTIFITQGLIVGLVGTVSGLIGGYGLCWFLKETELISLPADVYYLDHLPVQMRSIDFIVVAAAAMLISFLATIYPSMQAAKLDPIEPLRYE